MLDKLAAIHNRWIEIGEQMTDPDVIADMKKFIKLNKDYRDLEPIVIAYKEYKNVLENEASTREILDSETDDEFREMAKDELSELVKRREELEEEVKILMIPKDPEDAKNCTVEIRAGTGGDEASLFAGDLFRMYTKYCESKKWKLEIVDITEGTMGGYKEIVFNVSGNEVYGTLKYESGVHRVRSK